MIFTTTYDEYAIKAFELNSIDYLLKPVDPRYFFRINRQYMVNYHAIEKISVLSKSRVSIQTNPPVKEPLLVSTARTHEFRLWLDR